MHPREHTPLDCAALDSHPAHSGAARVSQGGFSGGQVGAPCTRVSEFMEQAQCGFAESRRVRLNLCPLLWARAGPLSLLPRAELTLLPELGLAQALRGLPAATRFARPPRPLPRPRHSPCTVPTLPSALPTHTAPEV